MKIFPLPTKDQASVFNDSLKEEKANSTRVITSLGISLFVIYSIFDYFGLPRETLEIIIPVRIINITVIALIFYLTFRPIFQKQYNKILLFGYYCSGITIAIGVYLSKPEEYSYNIYYAAIIILIITSFSWSYLPLKQSAFMSAFFIITYILMKIFTHKDTEGTEFLTFLSHIFFLVSVCVIAAIAQYIRDSLIYRNIQLQEDFKQIANEQTLEAKKQKKLANMDALTGVPNRRFITKKLKRAITELERVQGNLTLVFIDLDGFKSINDNYGHDSGDKVLEVTAKRLKQIIRGSDYLARLGGDEFLLGFKTSNLSSSFLSDLSENIKSVVAAPIAFNGNLLKVGVSLGYANYPQDGITVDALIKAADADMYIDKQKSKSSQRLVMSTAG